MFSISENISIIRLNGYYYALPLMSNEELRSVCDILSNKGYTVTLHDLMTPILSVIENEDDIKGFTWMDDYKPIYIVTLEDAYIARVAPSLMDEVGVKLFINSGPKFLKKLDLILDEEGQFVCVENAPKDLIVDKVVGYIDYEKGTFVSELGSYKYIREGENK